MALPDPYPPQVRKHVPYLWDASYFGGKYYIYFGITPVATLLLPFYALTGWFLPESIATTLFCIFGYLFSLLCTLELRSLLLAGNDRGQPPTLTPESAAFLSLGLGLGNLFTLLLKDPAIYETAIASGICFGMLTAYAMIRSVVRFRSSPRYEWLTIAGLSFGLAVGARPTLLFVGLLVIPVLSAIPHAKRTRSFVAFAIPCGLVGILLGIYNHLRFGAWWEFGRSYALDNEDLMHRVLSLTDVWTGVRNLLAMPPLLDWSWPFLLPRCDWPPPSSIHSNFAEPVIGMIWASPLILAVLLLFVPRCRMPRFPRSFLIGMLVIAFILLVLDSLVGQCFRYLVECLSFLLPPAIVCALLLAKCFCIAFPKWRYLSGFLCATATISLTLGLLVSLNSFQGNQKDLLSHYRRVLASGQENAETHEQAGQLLILLGRGREAVDEFQLALAFDPDMPEVHNNLGLLLSRQGLAEEALVHFRRAVALAPDNIVMHQNLADALQGAGDNAGTLTELLKLASRQPVSPEALLTLAAAYKKNGNLELALSTLRKALQTAQAQNNLPLAALIRSEIDKVEQSKNDLLETISKD
jgi:Tfp pilus assembly protein PilF